MKILRLLSIALLLMNLTGCAGVFIAGAATTANIVTDTRSTQQIWNDNNIEYDIAALNNKAPYAHQVRVTANSYLGTVVLMGQAATDSLNQQFAQDVKKIKGVKVVHNQVRIKAPLSVSAISNDSWITTKVKSSLLAKSELNGIKVKVITEDKEVFLFGYVSHKHADIATDVARNIAGVKQVIRAFQYPQLQQEKAKTVKKVPVAEVSATTPVTPSVEQKPQTLEPSSPPQETFMPVEETKSLASLESQ